MNYADVQHSPNQACPVIKLNMTDIVKELSNELICEKNNVKNETAEENKKIIKCEVERSSHLRNTTESICIYKDIKQEKIDVQVRYYVLLLFTMKKL